MAGTQFEAPWVGDGLTADTAFRPDVPIGIRWSLVDEGDAVTPGVIDVPAEDLAAADAHALVEPRFHRRVVGP